MSQSLKLDHSLLDTGKNVLEAPATFAACLNAHGLYNTLQFVLRLSPRVHQLLDAVPSGVYPAGEISFETLQAFSTYLHETVHWWQHMGSTTGLVISLCYPAQAHGNLFALADVVNLTGLNKSIKRWSEDTARSGVPDSNAGLAAAHTAVNNAVDIDYFKIFVMRPDLAREIDRQIYFESVGHSFQIAYTLTVDLIASTLDRDFRHIPNIHRWNAQFERLAKERAEGFYYGSPIRVGPVGVLALFEGQARFIQLQYLCYGKNDVTCDELRRAGYFDGVYGDAFRAFLRLTEIAWPDRIDHPLVALFLLICDLAINPTAGFPCDIENFESFILETDPGIRFGFLCLAAKSQPGLHTAITQYSREEYMVVAEALSAACGYDHPLRGLEVVARWTKEAPGVIKAMQEKETFNFQLDNLPVRVIFSHFAALSVDKLARPEFFCWAGAWLNRSRSIDDTQALWLRHLSIYADRADRDGIFPRDIPGKDRDGVFRTMNAFYGNNILYDLTRQWILQDGPFRYDYRWLSESSKEQKFGEFAKAAFERLYGAAPDKFKIL